MACEGEDFRFRHLRLSRWVNRLVVRDFARGLVNLSRDGLLHHLVRRPFVPAQLREPSPARPWSPVGSLDAEDLNRIEAWR